MTFRAQLPIFWQLDMVVVSTLAIVGVGASRMVWEQSLSRRERQVMDALFEAGEATAAEVHGRILDPPSPTAIRTMLRILEDKGLVEHWADGRRYVYRAKRSTQAAGQTAFERVLRVFFGGSLEQALAAHLHDPAKRPDSLELQRLRALIDEAGNQKPARPKDRKRDKS